MRSNQGDVNEGSKLSSKLLRGNVRVNGEMTESDAGTGQQAASGAVQKNSRMPQSTGELVAQAGPTAGTGMVRSYAGGVNQSQISPKNRKRVSG